MFGSTAISDYREHESVALLKGKHLIIGTIHFPPYVFVENSQGDMHVNGYNHQIIHHLSTKYNFKYMKRCAGSHFFKFREPVCFCLNVPHQSYTYIPSVDGAYGAPVKNNGSGWNGFIGMLLDKQLDVAGAALTVTYDRSRAVDFTAPIFEDPVSLLIPYPDIDGFPLKGLTKAFQTEVWLSIIASMLLCSLLLWIISEVNTSTPLKVFSRETRNTKWIPGEGMLIHPWTLFRIAFNADYFRLGTLSRQITLGVWCVIAVVLVNAYTGSLMAHLTATKQKTMIDSLEDLVEMLNSEGREAAYMVRKYSAFDTAIQKSQSGPLAKIRESLRKNPENLLTDTTNATELVATLRRAYAEERSALLAKIDEDFKTKGKCRLSVAKKPYDVSKIALALRKGSPLVSIFNEEIYRLRETGLLNHWYRTFSTKPNSCLAPLVEGGLQNPSGTSLHKSGRTRLTLAYLFGAFLLLGVGYAAGLLAFAIELLTPPSATTRRNKLMCHKLGT